jgi:hypothetical protein
LTEEVLRFHAEDVLPSMTSVLEAQGIPPHVHPDERTRQLVEEALLLYRATVQPVGVLLEVEKEVFASIFKGDGRNDLESPVRPISRHAESLALFAATLGQPVCSEISQAFHRNDFALGSMLDCVASEGAELTAQLLEDAHRNHLRSRNAFDGKRGTLRFSPGYCGWDMSGQRSLFQALQPGIIGITLNSSFLMQPIKSISGVIIAGKKEIFQFDDTFSFCRDCATHTCRDRISTLLKL